MTLSPILGLSSGMVFLIKAGMLTGTFYIQAVALFLCSVAMAEYPRVAHLIFGTISALCFLIPGWHYYRQKRNLEQTPARPPTIRQSWLPAH